MVDADKVDINLWTTMKQKWKRFVLE